MPRRGTRGGGSSSRCQRQIQRRWCRQILGVQRFFLQQDCGETADLVLPFTDDRRGPLIGLVDQGPSSEVNFACRLLAKTPPAPFSRRAQETAALSFIGHLAQVCAHPIARDHGTGDVGDALKIV